MPLALQTTQGMVLAHAVANELRARRILLPSVALIEKMCAIALTRAEREAFRRLTSGLTDKHRAALDAVLLVRPGGSSSILSWFRQPPGAPSAMRCSPIWRAYGRCVRSIWPHRTFDVKSPALSAALHHRVTAKTGAFDREGHNGVGSQVIRPHDPAPRAVNSTAESVHGAAQGKRRARHRSLRCRNPSA